MSRTGYTDLYQILLLGACAQRLETQVLGDSSWCSVGDQASPPAVAVDRARVVGIEVRNSEELEERLSGLFLELVEGGFESCYVALPDRKSLRIAQAVLKKLAPGLLVVYGVDPDYYHGLVPLTGKGHRAVERFVLGLKVSVGPRAAVVRGVKALLIRLGLSARLYESFVVVVEGPRCC